MSSPAAQRVFGKPCEAFLLVVVLVLVLGFPEFLDYEREDDDENEPGPTSSNHALRRNRSVREILRCRSGRC